jgi:hypothetical protein
LFSSDLECLTVRHTVTKKVVGVFIAFFVRLHALVHSQTFFKVLDLFFSSSKTRQVCTHNLDSL